MDCHICLPNDHKFIPITSKTWNLDDGEELSTLWCMNCGVVHQNIMVDGELKRPHSTYTPLGVHHKHESI